MNFAKGAALALDVPLIPVHHIRGHIAANYLAYPELEPPLPLPGGLRRAHHAGSCPGLYGHGDFGYQLTKSPHPTLGAGEVDGILTGDLQDRGQSYSWSMAEAGDYVHRDLLQFHLLHLPQQCKTTLDGMKSSGILDPELDTGKVADEIVQVAFGVDTF